jgi:hypothetical protein
MAMTLISTTTVGAGGSSSVSFSAIPGTYTDLLLVVSGRATAAGNPSQQRIRFNGDTAANYTTRTLQGTGSSANSVTYTTTYYGGPNIVDSSFTANTFGNASIYISNYASAIAKTLSVDSVQENNSTTSYSEISAGRWNNTAAITSIEIYNYTFAQYSTLSLYGILKGSGGATVS